MKIDHWIGWWQWLPPSSAMLVQPMLNSDSAGVDVLDQPAPVLTEWMAGDDSLLGKRLASPPGKVEPEGSWIALTAFWQNRKEVGRRAFDAPHRCLCGTSFPMTCRQNRAKHGANRQAQRAGGPSLGRCVWAPFARKRYRSWTASAEGSVPHAHSMKYVPSWLRSRASGLLDRRCRHLHLWKSPDVPLGVASGQALVRS